MESPKKRQRLSPPTEQHSIIGQHATREGLRRKLKSRFEAIFDKYGKDFTGVGDEIDLETGRIIVNNGHLLQMQDERDESGRLKSGKLNHDTITEDSAYDEDMRDELSGDPIALPHRIAADNQIALEQVEEVDRQPNIVDPLWDAPNIPGLSEPAIPRLHLDDFCADVVSQKSDSPYRSVWGPENHVQNLGKGTRIPWKPEEEELLLHLRATTALTYKQLCAHFPGRTKATLQERWWRMMHRPEGQNNDNGSRKLQSGTRGKESREAAGITQTNQSPKTGNPEDREQLKSVRSKEKVAHKKPSNASSRRSRSSLKGRRAALGDSSQSNKQNQEAAKPGSPNLQLAHTAGISSGTGFQAMSRFIRPDGQFQADVMKILSPWTSEEDTKLKCMRVGTSFDWKELEQYFPGRNAQAIRIRWSSIIARGDEKTDFVKFTGRGEERNESDVGNRTSDNAGEAYLSEGLCPSSPRPNLSPNELDRNHLGNTEHNALTARRTKRSPRNRSKPTGQACQLSGSHLATQSSTTNLISKQSPIKVSTQNKEGPHISNVSVQVPITKSGIPHGIGQDTLESPPQLHTLVDEIPESSEVAMKRTGLFIEETHGQDDYNFERKAIGVPSIEGTDLATRKECSEHQASASYENSEDELNYLDDEPQHVDEAQTSMTIDLTSSSSPPGTPGTLHFSSPGTFGINEFNVQELSFIETSSPRKPRDHRNSRGSLNTSSPIKGAQSHTNTITPVGSYKLKAQPRSQLSNAISQRPEKVPSQSLPRNPSKTKIKSSKDTGRSLVSVLNDTSEDELVQTLSNTPKPRFRNTLFRNNASPSSAVSPTKNSTTSLQSTLQCGAQVQSCSRNFCMRCNAS